MSLYLKLSAASVLLGTLLFTPMLPAQNPAADLVLIHGHILTVDANDSVAQAIAVRRGVIVKVGTDAEVLEFAGNAPGTRIIDLHGHTATPGLIDSHAHIADGGVEELYGVKLDRVRDSFYRNRWYVSEQSLLKAVAAHEAGKHPPTK